MIKEILLTDRKRGKILIWQCRRLNVSVGQFTALLYQQTIFKKRLKEPNITYDFCVKCYVTYNKHLPEKHPTTTFESELDNSIKNNKCYAECNLFHSFECLLTRLCHMNIALISNIKVRSHSNLIVHEPK